MTARPYAKLTDKQLAALIEGNREETADLEAELRCRGTDLERVANVVRVEAGTKR